MDQYSREIDELYKKMEQDAAEKNMLGSKRKNDISRRVKEIIDLEKEGDQRMSSALIWNQVNGDELALSEEVEMLRRDKARIVKEHAEEIKKLKEKHVEEMEKIKEEMEIKCTHCLSPIEGFIMFSCSKCFYCLCHFCQIQQSKRYQIEGVRNEYCRCEMGEFGYTLNNFSSSSNIGQILSKQSNPLRDEQDKSFMNHLEVLSKTLCTYYYKIHKKYRNFRFTKNNNIFYHSIPLQEAGINNYKIEIEPQDLVREMAQRKIKIFWLSNNMIFNSYTFKANSLYTDTFGIDAMIMDREDIDPRTNAIIKTAKHLKNEKHIFGNLNIFNDNHADYLKEVKTFYFAMWRRYLSED